MQVSQRLSNNSPCMWTTFLEPAVHVLGADEQAILQGIFKFGESEVRRIRLG